MGSVQTNLCLFSFLSGSLCLVKKSKLGPLCIVPFFIIAQTALFGGMFMSFKKHLYLQYKTGQTCHAYCRKHEVVYIIQSCSFFILSTLLYAKNPKPSRVSIACLFLSTCSLPVWDQISRLKDFSTFANQAFLQYDRQYNCAQFIFYCQKFKKICQDPINNNAYNQFIKLLQTMYQEHFWGCNLLPMQGHNISSSQNPHYLRQFYMYVQLMDTAFANLPNIIFNQILFVYLPKCSIEIMQEYLFDYSTFNQSIKIPKNPSKLFKMCFIGFEQCQKDFIQLMNGINK